jgi:crotonobetainyl-CoA:carnitine CoA-transferase CaiB-like acyl-CoA transferase
LNGIRVLDLSTIVAGPTASMILSDFGADIIKVERLGSGEDGRAMGPHRGEWGAYFTAINRGKRSIAVDIARPEGKEVVLKLAENCDVWLENFRGGAAARLGLDETVVRARNANIIYAALSAYGPVGPDYKRPGYDGILQARSGIVSVTGEDQDHTVRAGVSVLDMGSGIWMALGILAALLERKQSGKGQRVDASLLQTGVMFMAYHLLYRQFAGVNPAPQGSKHTAFAPYGAYQARDGAVMIGISGDKAFARLCDALGHPEWTTDPRFATNPERVKNTPALDELMTATLRSESAAHWSKRLDEANVANDLVQTPEQVMADRQVTALGQLEAVRLGNDSEVRLPRLPLNLSVTPPAIQGPPPVVGEHTRAILVEAGYTAQEIERLLQNGICGAA